MLKWVPKEAAKAAVAFAGEPNPFEVRQENPLEAAVKRKEQLQRVENPPAPMSPERWEKQQKKQLQAEKRSPPPAPMTA